MDSVYIHKTIQSLDIVSNSIVLDLPYIDTLSPHFSRINRFRYFNPVNSGYQLLKAKGAEVILQDELTYDLINYFEESLMDLEINMKIIQDHYYKYIQDDYRNYFHIDPSETLNSAINQNLKNFGDLKQNESFLSFS